MRGEGTRPGDGFGLTADPSAYVPRLALETALTALQEALAAPPACAALVGEPGLGKTLLLRVLAERVEGAYESLYVPFPRLAPSELWAWIAAVLGVPGSGDDRTAVIAHAQRSRDDGLGLLLLVDDAGALPPETRSELIHTCRAPGLALVMAFSTDDGALVSALPADVRRVELGAPMTLQELRAYVRTRLRRVDPGGVIGARLGSARLEELHEASGGVPARLHVLLDAWLRGRRVEPEAAAPAPAAEPARPVVPLAAAAPPDDELPTQTPPSSFRVERGPRARKARRGDDDAPQFFRRRRRGGIRLLPAVLVVLLLAGVWYVTSLPTVPAAFDLGEPAAPPPDVAAPAPAEPLPAVPIAEPEPIAAAPEPPLEPAAPLDGEIAAAAEPAPLPEPPPAEAPEPDAPGPSPEVAAAPEPKTVPEAAAPAAAPTPPEPEPLPPIAAAPPVLALPAGAPRPGARLSVNATPWAEIQLDGRALGQTPLGEVPLSPGRHRVSAKMPDGSIIERSVEARGGDVYVTFP
jgi:hypothetical protein